MFHYEDNITLTVDNIINKNGDITNYKLSFPIIEDELNIPDDIIEVSVFECNEGYDIIGYEVFKICVGNITSLNEIRKNQIKNIIYKIKNRKRRNQIINCHRLILQKIK